MSSTTRVQGGKLPTNVREVIRVTYSKRALEGKGSDWIRRRDAKYQEREGDPQHYTWDKDGYRFLRVIPSADGTSAVYDVVYGSRGTSRYRSSTSATATLTYTGQPSNGETVIVGGITYTFLTTLVAATENNGKVLIGATANASYTNLTNCINNSGGTSGTDYNAPLYPTTAAANPAVSAAISTTAGTVTLTADQLSQNVLPYGSLTVTETCSNMTADSTFDLGSHPDNTIVGSRGILRWRSDSFPSGGPWGTPVRHHPDTANIWVHIYRTGRDLRRYPFELPDYLMKYVYYYAMSMALRHEGPGQDIKMSDHYMQRFNMGVERLRKYRADIQRMRVIAMGNAPERGPSGFGLGDPTLSAYYPALRW